MAMNRETRRRLERQGEIAEDGTPKRQRREQSSGGQPAKERVSPGQFLSEIRVELKRVDWPTRPELVNYSIVVLITVVVLTAMIAGLDYAFGKMVINLFRV